METKIQFDIHPFEWDKHRYEWQHLEIAHEYPWNMKEFAAVLHKGAAANSFVALDNKEKLIGYIVGTPDGNELEIINLMVMPELRKCGIGRRLVGHMILKSRKRRKKELTVIIRETNETAQYFFRACGFKWVETLKDYYDGIKEDCYYMKRDLP